MWCVMGCWICSSWTSACPEAPTSVYAIYRFSGVQHLPHSILGNDVFRTLNCVFLEHHFSCSELVELLRVAVYVLFDYPVRVPFGAPTCRLGDMLLPWGGRFCSRLVTLAPFLCNSGRMRGFVFFVAHPASGTEGVCTFISESGEFALPKGSHVVFSGGGCESVVFASPPVCHGMC